MILTPIAKIFHDFDSSTFITVSELLSIIEESPFREELIATFNINNTGNDIIQVGNANILLESIEALDSRCKKVDVLGIDFKNIYLDKLLTAVVGEFLGVVE
jgi:hypothetical protein